MDDKQVIARAKHVISDARTGLLTTIGLDGSPNIRWMATHSLVGNLDTLYTITGPDTTKVEEIELDERVTWLFSRVNYTEVVKVRAAAEVDDDPLLRNQVWDSIGKRTQRYFTMREGRPEFTVIISRVREIEYLAPPEDIFTPIRVIIAED